MSDPITVRLNVGTEREVELPFMQALALAELMEEFEAPFWHFAECGCCIVLHERHEHGVPVTGRGYLIGADGGYSGATMGADGVIVWDEEPGA